jgi:hypothetical protein
LVLLASVAGAQEVQPVEVVNDSPLAVRGSVKVEGIVSHGRFLAFEGVAVAPAGRLEINDLTSVGMIETDGFTSVVLSLQGERNTQHAEACSLGAVLIPDQPNVLRALREEAQYRFALEAKPKTPTLEPSFATEPERFMVAFPRYRIFLYNECRTTAAVDLYLYLTTS